MYIAYIQLSFIFLALWNRNMLCALRALLCAVPGGLYCVLLGPLQSVLCVIRTASSELAVCLAVCMILNEMWFELNYFYSWFAYMLCYTFYMKLTVTLGFNFESQLLLSHLAVL